MVMSDEQKEKLKRAIFDGMSLRRQKHILKKGYEKWDPFEEPKDPLDMRMDRSRRTMNDLIREFLQTWDTSGHGDDYSKGALEICLGIINEDERYIGMFEFACWYRNLLDREGCGKLQQGNAGYTDLFLVPGTDEKTIYTAMAGTMTLRFADKTIMNF